VPEARELADEVRGPIKDSGDVRARFMLELAESGNFYADGRFAEALALIERALISGESSRDLTRVMLTRQWRCDILMLNDRLDQCLDAAVENVALAQKHHQAWALRVFETGRARTLLQLGHLAEAHMKGSWFFEPEPEELLPMLFEEYASLSVYRALLESAASEHGARMTAMRNAAENAQDMISSLTLEMNRVRQAEITQEILEVVAGAEALG